MANFIIISGAPASGKTTLANQLSKKLNVPAISKDDIKISLAESIPGEGLEWSMNIGKASIELLKKYVFLMAQGRDTIIIESAFIKKFDSVFLNDPIFGKSKVVQLHCRVNQELQEHRFQERLASGKRHPCHQDHLRGNEFIKKAKAGVYDPLEIKQTLIVDTGSEYKLDEIVEFILST